MGNPSKINRITLKKGKYRLSIFKNFDELRKTKEGMISLGTMYYREIHEITESAIAIDELMKGLEYERLAVPEKTIIDTNVEKDFEKLNKLFFRVKRPFSNALRLLDEISSQYRELLYKGVLQLHQLTEDIDKWDKEHSQL